MSVKIRLGIMMFLQYAIWGAWAPVLSEYLGSVLGYSPFQVSFIYALLPLATIISPFVGGQIADRYFSSQKVVAFLQLTGGALLVWVSTISDYSTMMWVMAIYCLIYAPTLALTNSIAFINLKNSEKEFGYIRVWGTIGWIAAGLLLAGWRKRRPVDLQRRYITFSGAFFGRDGNFFLSPPSYSSEKRKHKTMGFCRSAQDDEEQEFCHIYRHLFCRSDRVDVLLHFDSPLSGI